MSDICPVCGLPQDLCMCKTIAKEGATITIKVVKRRYGKKITLIEGVEAKEINGLAKKLKAKLACGGTVKENIIELQGDHRQRVKAVLVKMGYTEDAISVM